MPEDPSAQQVSGAEHMSLLFDLVASGTHQQRLCELQFHPGFGYCCPKGHFPPCYCGIDPCSQQDFRKDFFSCLDLVLSASLSAWISYSVWFTAVLLVWLRRKQWE